MAATRCALDNINKKGCKYNTDSTRNDSVSRQQWLDFIRPNTHTNAAITEELSSEIE
ncbi:MAG: hypothetical protein V3V18_10245 [Methylococcales bacterium]